MVGASLACALADQRVKIALLEAVPPGTDNPPSFDDRGISLSLSSQRIFSALGLWSGLEATARPVRHIQVTEQGKFGGTRLHAAAPEFDALGYIVIARELGQVLNKKLAVLENVDLICPARVDRVTNADTAVQVGYTRPGLETETIRAGLLVVADGSGSRTRSLLGIGHHEKDYRQTAIITNVTVERPLEDTAFERFTPAGPLALLPLDKDRYVAVVTVAAADADTYLALEDVAFLDYLQQCFGRRLGRFIRMGRRSVYPLQMIRPDAQLRERAVLLGNSAHTLHPVGAQGFNLCLRDMFELAQRLCGAFRTGNDPGSRALLEGYVAARLPEQERVIAFADRLTWLFCNTHPVKTVVRNAAMLLLDLVPPLKQGFISRVTGLRSIHPALLHSADRA
jgi:2-octaprenyl-6-methoxyphenol hydroxylase